MKELISSATSQLPELPPPAPHELFQKRWFCVAMYPSGKTFKQDAESPMPFLEVMNRAAICWIDYITDDPKGDLPNAATQLGFTERFVASVSSETTLNYEDADTELWMRFPCIQVRGINVTAYPLFMLIRRNVVFTVHASLVDKRFIRLRRYGDTILKKVPTDIGPEDKLTVLAARIIDTNNDSNFRHLRVIEERGDELNDDLLRANINRTALGPKIYEMKHAIITYMNALWESVDVLHTLRYGDAELITNDEQLLETISVMIDEVKAQIGLAEHMSTVIASGLEVMQTIYNNQLQTINNRLSTVITYLTVIGTAVLVPNTLGTLMSNSVFDIGPEDLWWWLILMIGATVLSTVGMWWWLKNRGWLPGKDEQ